MSERSAERLAMAAALLVGVFALVSGLFLFWWNRRVLYGNDVFLWSLASVTALAFAIAGVAIVRRSSAHAVGWLCLLTGIALEASFLLSHYGIYALVIAPGSLPGAAIALAFAEPLPLLYIVGLSLILLLFPTGHPINARWRVWVGVLIAGFLLSATTIVQPHVITDIWSDELSHAGAGAADPLGVLALAGVTRRVLEPLGGLLIAIGSGAAVVSLFVRRRRATPTEREQIRWVALVAGAAAAWIVLMLPIMLLTEPATGDGLAGALFWGVITPLVALGPPIAIGIGIVKYRLFDIDVVIRKTVVVAVIGFALTFLYLAVLALAAVAPVSRALVGLALVAITFNPVRRAARAIGDRVAYGRRASSYEVLSDFSERIAETYAADDVLPRMAAVLASGTGAQAATVWLRVGAELRPEASVGADEPPEPVPLRSDDLPDLPGDATEIRQAGELLGALSVTMPPNDPLDPPRRALIQDMAAQAGLVLRNVRLIEELRASRQRLVAAQDEERRKLERNIHDGAQQQLVALTVQLKLARTMLARDAERADAMLEGLEGATTQALEDLRDLARGIYPPLLADRGLEPALTAQARKAAVPVTVACDGIGRYGQDVEAAVYFCTLEALNNVAKYAAASRATVRLEHTDGTLTFTIADDGAGFDPAVTSYGTGLQGMADRLDAIGGALRVTSAPGAGTTVAGTVPI
jgi:signal transduction histidine kinase